MPIILKLNNSKKLMHVLNDIEKIKRLIELTCNREHFQPKYKV
jgi:hypothetical protein